MGARTGWRGAVAAAALAGWGALAGCHAPADAGSSRFVTAGSSPGSLAAPASPRGGLIEVARVRFAGQGLTTDLVGDPGAELADGQSLIVGGAGFAFPVSVEASEALQVLPPGPVLLTDDKMRCETRIGPLRNVDALPGIPVNAGDELVLQDGAGGVRMTLLRFPLSLSEVPSSPVSYRMLEAPRDKNADQAANWSAGAPLTLSVTGGNPSSTRSRGSIPIAGKLTADRMTLPLAFSELVIGTTPLQEAPYPTFDLPGAGESLDLTWKSHSAPQDVIVSIEYYGAGSGRCPSACGRTEECCQRDDECSALERCAVRSDGARACMPRYGAASDRLGALVCSVRDTGTASIPGEMLQTLNSSLAGAGVSGVVVRIGRSVSTDLTFPDAMTAVETRQSLSPVRYRASDVVLTRFNPPGL